MIHKNLKKGLFLMAMMLVVSVSAGAQNISVKYNNTPISKVLSDIESKSNYTFVYQKQVTDNIPAVTCTMDNAPLTQVLDRIFGDSNLNYEIVRQTIVLTKMKAAPASSDKLVSVKGTVSSIEEKITVPFASIVVKGTMQGIQADADGKFELKDVPSDAVLVVSSIGYTTRNIEIAGKKIMDIALHKDAELLEETVVVAYGTAKKGSITGSAAVVDKEKLEKRVATNLGRALEGQVAGVMMTSGTGQPGEGSSIVVRGYGSINASKTPLYVVDGIPYDAGLVGLNPNDIESITVLKDASSGALYGARGANGVVLVTTKKGSSGTANIAYSGSVGWSNPALAYYERVGQKDFVQLSYESLKNTYVASGNYSDEQASELAKQNLGSQLGGELYNPFKNYTWETIIGDDGYVRSDAVSAWDESWLDDGIIQKNALRTEHNVTVSGGSDKLKGLLSVGYLDENGYAKQTGFKRLSGRANVDANVTPWLASGLNVSFANAKYEGIMGTGNATSSYFYSSLIQGPIYPLYKKDLTGADVLDENGDRVLDYGEQRPFFSDQSTLGLLLDDSNDQTNMMESARGYIRIGSDSDDASFLKGLKMTVNFGANNRDLYQTTYNNMNSGPYADANGRIVKIYSRRLSYTLNELLTYNRSFGDHTFDVLAGHESYKQTYNYLEATKSNLFEGIKELRPATTNAECDSYSQEYAIESYMSRFNYDYLNKYYFSASYRRDGSSRFKAENRWGNFWSVGGNWRVSKEKFMQNISWLNNLNVKASYGVQGNDDLDTYYAWQSFYSLAWPNDGNTGAKISSLENPDVTWEKNANFNVGFDAKLLDSRLDVSLEWYNRKTTDMLLSYPMALSTGFTGYNANVGSLVNKGIEFSLGGVIIDSKDFMWRANILGTSINNKILKLTDESPSFISGVQIYEEGRSMYTFYMAKFAGVNSETGAEQWYKYDSLDDNGNPVNETITENYAEASVCKYYIGTRMPKLSGSVSTDFEFFKCVDLSILTTYSLGGYIYDGVNKGLVSPSSYGSAISTAALNRWQKPGDVTDQPAFRIGYSSNYTSDRYLVNASYLSIKNITLGYTLPAKYARIISAKKVRAYASLDNFKMFSHLKGMNPQYNMSGSTEHAYAPSRTTAIGINLNF